MPVESWGNESTVTSNVLAVESLDHCASRRVESVNVGVASRFASGLVNVTPNGGFLCGVGLGATALAVADGAAKMLILGRFGGGGLVTRERRHPPPGVRCRP